MGHFSQKALWYSFADGFVETAVGHYFWYFSFLLLVLVLLVTTVAKLA